jgi:hypothetical protein
MTSEQKERADRLFRREQERLKATNENRERAEAMRVPSVLLAKRPAVKTSKQGLVARRLLTLGVISRFIDVHKAGCD